MPAKIAPTPGSSPAPSRGEFAPAADRKDLGRAIARRVVAGIDRRGWTDKRAAFEAGVHPSCIKHLRAGLTARVDAALLAALARRDRAWLNEIYGPALDANGQAVAGAFGAAAAPSLASFAPHKNGPAYWFDDTGAKLPALPDPGTSARLALALPDTVDAVAVAFNLGWVLIRAADGKFEAGPSASVAALEAARAYLTGGPEAAPPAWTIEPGAPEPGWGKLAVALQTQDPRAVLARAHLMDDAALYRVTPQAIVTIWLGRQIRTGAEALGVPLAGRRDRVFAGLLERQIRAHVAQGAAARVTRFRDVTTAGVRASWKRLAAFNPQTGLMTHVVRFDQIEELG